MTQRILGYEFRFLRWLVPLAVLLLLGSVASFASAAGSWTATGDMANGFMHQAMAQLADGRVLVAGGPGMFANAKTEIFDPATNAWSTASNMSVSRAYHTATTLNDGRVLVTGGIDSPVYASVTYDSSEIFDLATGNWSTGSTMNVARSEHGATLLDNGRVLVTGGRGLTGSGLNSAEIFDPASGTWTATGSMSAIRLSHTATRLNDGRVLVVGGLSEPEIFDPASGTWSAAGTMNTLRIWHSAELLSDGRVMVVGGSQANAGGQFIPLASAEIFDPATGAWTITGTMQHTRARFTATRLSDDRVLAAGGFNDGSTHSSAEIFDPATGTWAVTGSMIDARKGHRATLLNDGRALIVGGESDGGTCCAELFTLDGGASTPTPTPTFTPTPTPPPSGSNIVYVSSTSGGSAGGVSFADEDILAHDLSTGAWSLHFDGSDVGLGSTDINAFDILDDGTLLLSINSGDFSLSGFGTVDDSDILHFVPTSLGNTTAGSFAWYVDGSDVGLSSSGEDIDAIHQLDDGSLVISTLGSHSVSGVSGKDEDLVRFVPTGLGASTAGSWELYFDGSDVGLSNSSDEDVFGTFIDDDGTIYLTTRGTFSVSGVSGDGADVFACTPGSLGTTTSCSFSAFWDGSANEFGSERMDGLALDNSASAASAGLGQANKSDSSGVDQQSTHPMAEDSDDDVTGQGDSQIFLPLTVLG